MSEMTIYILGSAGWIPGTSETSCIMVENRGELFLLDAGTGMSNLRKYREVLDRYDTVHLLLSHYTASVKKKKKMRPPKEWIIPANPKYYDIVYAFDDTDVIDWKQGAGIKKGDTVFMYVGAPVSAVMYKCKVIETGIPCRYENRYITIKALMKIRLQKRYETDRFTFDVLKAKYGIYAVRGPRGIPDSLTGVFNL